MQEQFSKFRSTNPSDGERADTAACVKVYADLLQKRENELVLAAEMGQFLLKENEALKQENKKLQQIEKSYRADEAKHQENIYLQRTKLDSALKQLTEAEKNNDYLESKIRDLQISCRRVDTKIVHKKQRNRSEVEMTDDDEEEEKKSNDVDLNDRIYQLESELRKLKRDKQKAEQINNRVIQEYETEKRRWEQANGLLKNGLKELSATLSRERNKTRDLEEITIRLKNETHQFQQKIINDDTATTTSKQNNLSEDAMYFHFHMIVQSLKIVLEHELNFDTELIFCDKRLSSERLYSEALSLNMQFFDWPKWLREKFTRAHVELTYSATAGESDVMKQARELLESGAVTRTEYVELIRADSSFRINAE